jgi:hypothetical protein
MKVFSSTTGKKYEVEEATHYRNMAQCAFMLSKTDCELLDVFENGGKIVMVFPRWMHEKYIREWAERPHENKENNNG